MASYCIPDDLMPAYDMLQSAGLPQRFRQQLSLQEEQLMHKDRHIQEMRQQLTDKDKQLASKAQQLADKDREITRLVGLSSEGLLKYPPVRAHAQRDCMVCMETIPPGSIICMQKGCALVLCQDCASEMCRARTRSSGSDGSSNGELMCTHCNPSHSIAPATLARAVPKAVFQGLQVR